LCSKADADASDGRACSISIACVSGALAAPRSSSRVRAKPTGVSGTSAEPGLRRGKRVRWSNDRTWDEREIDIPVDSSIQSQHVCRFSVAQDVEPTDHSAEIAATSREVAHRHVSCSLRGA
jgi:hypothetical protein